MTAREYFEQARASQRAIDRRLAVIESMKAREAVRAQRYDAIGHGSGPASNGMEATDARIDAEQQATSEVRALAATVEEARTVCRGVRMANPHTRWGDVLELRFCEDMQWKQVAHALDVTDRQAKADTYSALEWVDLVGISAARNGMGQAALF